MRITTDFTDVPLSTCLSKLNQPPYEGVVSARKALGRESLLLALAHYQRVHLNLGEGHWPATKAEPRWVFLQRLIPITASAATAEGDEVATSADVHTHPGPWCEAKRHTGTSTRASPASSSGGS